MKNLNSISAEYLRELSQNVDNVAKEIEKVKERAKDDDLYLDFTKDLEILQLKEIYSNDILQMAWERQNIIKSLRDNPNKEKSYLKELRTEGIWDIFLDNLEPASWIPVTDDMCDECGRVHSSLSAVVARHDAKTNEYKLQCSRCFREELEKETSK
jgi:hypothetical protein